MKLTDEQACAVDLFGRSASLKISAFAGTGKTSTLSALAKSTRKSGLYLAFNKSIATEAAGRFPLSVDCRTTHSLAFKAVPGELKGNIPKLTQSLQGNRVAQLLSIEELVVGNITMKPRSLGHLTARTVQRFCHSGDDELGRQHVPMTGKLKELDPRYQEEFRVYVSKLAAHLWDQMRDPTSDAPLGHDGYLKLWSLSKPRLNYDFILLDEAQDTNEAVLTVLRQQGCQLTLVGDRHQQIYEWRGAINAMASVETAAEAYLTKSFRFGTELAAAATTILRVLKETRSLVGDASRQTRIAAAGRTGTTLCRTNAGVVEVVLAAMSEGRTPHVVGGVAELVRMLEDVTRLRSGAPAECPDFFGFHSWAEVVDFADSEEGESLRSFVRLVNAYGEVPLMQKLRSTAREECGASEIVSTGHKAKGREWNSVTLHSDFEPRLNKEVPPRTVINEEEARLLYVAVTRARELLVVPSRLADKWNVPSAVSPQPVLTMQGGVKVSASRTPRPELPSFARPASKTQGLPASLPGAGSLGKEQLRARRGGGPATPKVTTAAPAPAPDDDAAVQVAAKPQGGLLTSLLKMLLGAK